MDGMPSGYRPLSGDQLAQLARIKLLKDKLADELTKLATINHEAMPAVLDEEGRKREAEIDRSNDSLFEARRYLQTGFMWLTRAIANPEGL